MIPGAKWRARLGARGAAIALLAPVALLGVLGGGPRAALVLAFSIALTMAAGIVPRALAGAPFRWFNPGSVITGLLLGLTLKADTPLPFIVVGALVAELPGKWRLPRLGRNLFNPAAFGRAAVAVLEVFEPVVKAAPDAVSAASPLAKEAGGFVSPAVWDLLAGARGGAIGETSALLLGLVAALMIGVVALKREAPLALLVTAPVLVAFLPATTQVAGHAPWLLDPAIYLLGSATLLNAAFFATDPVTAPQTRIGGLAFGFGAAAIGVFGRLYTSIPGAEMWGVLIMNAATPALDRFARPRRARPVTMTPLAASLPDEHGRTESLPAGPGLTVLPAPRVLDGVRLDPAAALAKVRASGLRGCGGAGFPVADKWAAALRHPGPRVLVVNGQEGEPETFKDRYLLQHHAASVAEGAMIAATVLGADRVVFVLDPAFHAGARALEHALVDLRHEAGPLPACEIRRGPGRYVAGEETALLDFLAGGRVEAHPRPPYPSERGLDGRPTVVQNVETLAWLPAVLGSDRAPPRLVSLSGAVRHPGVYEVEPGTPLRDILSRGGGLCDDARLGGFAVGGWSGGLLPPDAIDTPFEARALAEAGASIGTGAVRVLDAGECVVREALTAARFFRDESCGRCTPCRVGTGDLARLWGALADGALDDVGRARIATLSAVLARASTCGLGIAAPGRVVSVIRHWPQAVAAHAEKGRCDACNPSS